MKNLGSLLVAASCLAVLTGWPAHAADFTARVDTRQLRPAGPCDGGALRCGEAFVEGYGAADWTFTVEAFEVVSATCIDYTATTTFTLADDSTLTLSETGSVCSPGKSLLATPPFSWGNPATASATWEVTGATGQFAGLTGSGEDLLDEAGALMRGAYTGELG